MEVRYYAGYTVLCSNEKCSDGLLGVLERLMKYFLSKQWQ